MRNSPRRHGFSLIEVTLAIGVAGFCLIAIMGLLPVGITSNRAAVDQAAATDVITAISSDLRATPSTTPVGGAASSVQYSIPIPANPVTASPTATTLYFAGDGSFSATSASGMRFRATIAFLVNSGSRSATQASIKVSWPPTIDPASGTPEGSVISFVALDRN